MDPAGLYPRDVYPDQPPSRATIHANQAKLPFVCGFFSFAVRTRPVPTAMSEQEVAENPAVYAEDAGAYCRPFANPERVLGERAFHVIMRVEQPAISGAPSVKTAATPRIDFELPAAAVRDPMMGGGRLSGVNARIASDGLAALGDWRKLVADNAARDARAARRLGGLGARAAARPHRA